ncbi:hypothetical protein GOV04_00460 [Candidatus Woesearchaeota archaeon]|nr:hypothetical protein [Candidatus Woesearchaeota archaeon]
MTNRIFIVHCWDGSPNDGWYPWLKKELETNGFEVQVLQMPEPEEPKIETWVSYLQEAVGVVDENTYFVGHSIGAQTIMRYLEGLVEGSKVGGVVFVGGWFNLLSEAVDDEESQEIAKPWLTKKIDFEKVKNTTDKFIAIFSDDDYFVPLTDKELFEERLGAKTMVEVKKGHFSEDDGVKELPIVLDSVLELSN